MPYYSDRQRPQVATGAPGGGDPDVHVHRGERDDVLVTTASNVVTLCADGSNAGGRSDVWTRAAAVIRRCVGARVMR